MTRRGGRLPGREGARPGIARAVLYARLPIEMVERVDAAAEAANVSQNIMVERLLAAGLRDYGTPQEALMVS